MNSNILKPILQAIFACFLWGIVFAMPVYLNEFSSVDIILGRFLVYGTLSTLLLIFYVKVKREAHCLKYWKQAALCAVIMNMIYFTALVQGCKCTAPSMITLIIGTGPITITIFSCLLKKDKSLLSLFLLPSFVIFLGLCLMSFEAVTSEVSQATLFDHVQGFVLGFIALAAWTWYVIFNSKVLRQNPDINPIQWTALIGTITFFLTIIGLLIQFGVNEKEYFTQFSVQHEAGQMFWSGVLVLGIFCSWAAFTLWNLAGSHLHPALSGQISVLETFFGLILIYTLQKQYPSLLEFIGALCILLGVSFGVYSFSKNEKSRNKVA